MTSRIAILTPDPSDPAYRARWPRVLELTASPLRRAGFDVEPRSWTEAAGLAGFDLVLPLLVWGYPQVHAQWLDRMRQWEVDGVRLQNRAHVLRWNTEKTYLRALADRGAPVVPTLFAKMLDEPAMEAAAEQFGTDRLVAKPQVSAGAWQTVIWSPGQSLHGGPDGAAMIQPYLPSIESSGETSLFYFGGRFSHAVSKRPQPRDFRVQPEHRGIIIGSHPAEDELEAAERVLGTIDEHLLYARVDLVRTGDGSPALIELELIEPDLYLEHDPRRGDLLGQAVAELIGR